MVKKILACALALLMVVGSGLPGNMNVLPDMAVSVSAYTYGDFEYSVLDDGTVEISKYIGDDAEVEIPTEIDGKRVTSIGGYAFDSCTSLTSITIPDSVTSIGVYAFYGCTSLTSITIPDSVTYIAHLAFDRCTSLTSITIPDSVTSISNQTFYRCTSLTSITVDSKNSNYSSLDGVLYNKDETALICCPEGKTSITIPDSVTSIEGGAFDGYISLTSITIPDSVTSIGEYAFSECTSLTSITIPDSVTSIGDWAFESCTSLTSITIPDSVTGIGEHAFGYDYNYDTDQEKKLEGFKIHCYADTEGEQYAIDNGFDYELLDPEDDDSSEPEESTSEPDGDSTSSKGDLILSDNGEDNETRFGKVGLIAGASAAVGVVIGAVIAFAVRKKKN